MGAVRGEQVHQWAQGGLFVQCPMGRVTDVEHGILDERHFHGRLAGEVLVERRRLDVQLLRQSPHRERNGPLALQYAAGRSDSLDYSPRARRWRIGALELSGEQRWAGPR